MMRRLARPLVALIAATLLALLLAGCGGEEAGTSGTSGNPSPTTGDTSGLTNNGAGNTSTDPAVTDPSGNGDASTDGADQRGETLEEASIPDLDGGDVSNGLPSLAGTSIFEPQAVEEAQSASSDAAASSLDAATIMGGSTSTTTSSDSKSTTDDTIAVDYSAATIYLNGSTIKVKRGGTFPVGAPMFRLVGVTASDIEIELIAGRFVTEGGSGLFIDRGVLVTLGNQSEQTTYRLKYLRPIATSSAL